MSEQIFTNGFRDAVLNFKFEHGNQISEFSNSKFIQRLIMRFDEFLVVLFNPGDLLKALLILCPKKFDIIKQNCYLRRSRHCDFFTVFGEFNTSSALRSVMSCPFLWRVSILCFNSTTDACEQRRHALSPNVSELSLKYPTNLMSSEDPSWSLKVLDSWPFYQSLIESKL
jgi:hypothetical protein